MKLLVWFLSGLGSLVGGLIVWAFFTILDRAAREERPFLDFMSTLGFIIMVGGPIVFWLALPIGSVLFGRSKEDG